MSLNKISAKNQVAILKYFNGTEVTLAYFPAYKKFTGVVYYPGAGSAKMSSAEAKAKVAKIFGGAK